MKPRKCKLLPAVFCGLAVGCALLCAVEPLFFVGTAVFSLFALATMD